MKGNIMQNVIAVVALSGVAMSPFGAILFWCGVIVFVVLVIAAVCIWMALNVVMSDPYPGPVRLTDD